MLIRLSHDLNTTTLLRQTKKSLGEWGDITYTECEVDECDILLCLSYPHKDINICCSETWLLSQEPPARIRRWERDSYKYFDRIFSTWSDLPNKSQPCTHWFPEFNYDEFCLLKPTPKSKKLSWVTSTNSDLKGHQLRIKLLNYLEETNLDFDLYGRGFTFINDKADGLINYKYSLAIENFSTNDYWTEKIADCLLCWTIPLYWGALNIDKYLPKGSYIPIDPSSPKKALATILDTINSDYYENHIEIIREARELILNKYQLFPHVNNLVGEYFLGGPKRDYFIPKNIHPKKDYMLRKLRYKINYRLSKNFNL